jgi:hypothetical protein
MEKVQWEMNFEQNTENSFNFYVLYLLHTNLCGDQGMRMVPPWLVHIVKHD